MLHELKCLRQAHPIASAGPQIPNDRTRTGLAGSRGTIGVSIATLALHLMPKSNEWPEVYTKPLDHLSLRTVSLIWSGMVSHSLFQLYRDSAPYQDQNKETRPTPHIMNDIPYTISSFIIYSIPYTMYYTPQDLDCFSLRRAVDMDEGVPHLSTQGVEARKFKYDCPPSPKHRERRKTSLNRPTSRFQLSGAYCTLYLQ